MDTIIRNFTAITICCFYAIIGYAQEYHDVIIKKNGEEIVGEIIEQNKITTSLLTFQGITIEIKNSDITLIDKKVIETLKTPIEKPVVAQITEKRPYPFAIVEIPPKFPGCESETNEDSKNCTNTKIRLLVRKFEPKLIEFFKSKNLTGRQRLTVLMTISETGHIKSLNYRAPLKNNELDIIMKEFQNSFPMMTPGYEKGIPVDVNYGLPIIINI